jgi:transketolase
VATFDAAASRARCRRYRKRILDLSQSVPAMHIAPAFSCLEILDVVYQGFIEPSGRSDTFLLSKGHGVMAQYCLLEEIGVLDSDELEGAERDGSRLGGHPDYGLPGIEASTGSLGHGLPMAVGMAYGDKLAGRNSRVFVVLSDGEMQEGSTWEAAMLAAALGLSKIVAIVDLNDMQSLGRISEMIPSFHPLDEKLRAFGWEVASADGHDQQALYDAIDGASGDRPMVIVAKTLKGKGVSFMEGVPIWYYRSPSPEEYKQALAEVEAS